ncbi:MAG: hypothetical protein HYV63_20450 [Candidatus Schekmanbacteria bacterium]|nr:hypothetical protein [Candidatus Schekmanbacteria bacterium]
MSKVARRAAAALGRLSAILTLTMSIATPSADPFAAADISVSAEVVAADVEPIGANLTTIAGGTNLAINNLLDGGGFEPTVWRRFIRIDRAEDGWIEWDSLGGVGFWGLTWTGFGNGATIRFYRIVDSAGEPLPYAQGLNDIAGADHVIFLGETTVPMPSSQLPDGGWIADTEQQRVHLSDAGLDLRFGDYAYIVRKTDFMPQDTSAPDFRQYWGGDRSVFSRISGTYTARVVPHPGSLPDDFQEPGETCLAITLPEAGTVVLGQYTYYAIDDGEGQFYSQLHPGAPYRVEAWMRQEGLADGGRARFQFNGAYDSASQQEPWLVTADWRRFTYDFVGPEYPPQGQSHIAHALSMTGPGTLWIDNFAIYRNDEQHGFAPYGPHEVAFDELMRSFPAQGRKPAVRFYPVSYSFTPDALAESMFGNYPNGTYVANWFTAVTGGPPLTYAQALSWALRTGSTPDERVVPYLAIPEEYTESEWRALVEFLGVPYDAEIDSPQSKPHAFRRYQFRGGDGTPWTDEFREILLEYGNETWHNGAGGYGWDGFGPPGWVHFGGAEYGLFARFMIEDNAMAVPAWNALDLGRKIKFVLGGNYMADPTEVTSYGEQAVQRATSISYVGHANYVGPRWETGDTGFATFNDHGVQETLIAMETNMKGIIDDAVAARATLNATAGTDYRVMAYEGGPSGYWQNQENPEIDELYGKSLAMGVAALDAWLYSSLRGYGHQCYLGFSSGSWWTSHTMPEAGGFRPHPGWLALRLRNRHARGSEMTRVSFASAPSYDRGGAEIPLITAYALRDATSYSVFVLSRKLDGEHDGVDFGDGYTPVTLRLPFAAPARVTVHKLAQPDGRAADPRSNNRAALNVDIVSQDLPVSAFSPVFVLDETRGADARGIPPGTAYLYVFALEGVTAVPVLSLRALLAAAVAAGAGLRAVRKDSRDPRLAPAAPRDRGRR